MAIASVGFDGTVTEAQWSVHQMRVSETAYRHGIWSGGTVTVGVGTRAVSVSIVDGIAAGVRFLSDAAETVLLTANASSNRRQDYVVAEVNWTTNTTTIKALAGVAATNPTPPALTQSAGALWQVPLARVTVPAGATAIPPGNITEAKPLRRQTRIFRGDIVSLAAGVAGARIVSTLSIDDPGWPYRLDVTAALRMAASPGQAAEMYVRDEAGATICGGISPVLSGRAPVTAADISGVYTGVQRLTLHISALEAGAGGVENMLSYTNTFTARQIPA